MEILSVGSSLASLNWGNRYLRPVLGCPAVPPQMGGAGSPPLRYRHFVALATACATARCGLHLESINAEIATGVPPMKDVASDVLQLNDNEPLPESWPWQIATRHRREWGRRYCGRGEPDASGRRHPVRTWHRRQSRDDSVLVEPVRAHVAAEIRKRRVDGRNYSNWRWHLDEVFLRINGERHYRCRRRVASHQSSPCRPLAARVSDTRGVRTRGCRLTNRLRIPPTPRAGQNRRPGPAEPRARR